MDLRDSFSRLKKKVKHLGSKRKQDSIGLNAVGESVGPANPLPGSESHIVAGSGGGIRADTFKQRGCSVDRSPQTDVPESVSTCGSEGGQGEGGVDVDGTGVRHLCLDDGGGLGQGGNNADEEEEEQFHSRSSAPPTPRDGGPDSM